MNIHRKVAATLALPIAGILLAATCPVSGEPGSTDANAIVRQMVAAYQSASSIQEVSTVDFVVNGGTRISQTYRLKYQRANSFVIVSEDPRNGTLAAYSNGRTVHFYSAALRTYSVRPIPADLAGSISTMEQLAKHVTGSGFDQNLNPISFLLAHGAPRECRNFKSAGTGTVLGHKVDVVTGGADESWAQSIAPEERLKFAKGDLTLSIDASTRLLVRAQAHLTWKPLSPARGKNRAVPDYTVTFTETHFNTTLNKSIPASEFIFTPGKEVVFKP